MKRILLTASVLLSVYLSVSHAQQDPKFTHYMFNQVVYNPAFIGAEMGDNFCFNFVQHNQWMGFKSEDESTAPLTTAFNLHKPFTIKGKKFGAGLIFTNDGLGFQSTTNGALGLSYHHDLGKDAAGKQRWLIGGLNIGFVQTGLDGSKLKFIDEGDAIITALMADGKHMALDAGIGLLYKTDNYYLGVSTLHIPQSNVDWFGGLSTTDETKLNRHFYVNGGYDYQLNTNIKIKGVALLKFDRAVWQLDAGALLEYDEKVWAGMNIRRTEGFSVLVGGKIWQHKTPKGVHVVKLGLSYDITTSKIQGVSNGTLEIMLNYCLPIKLTPKPPTPEQDVRILGGYTF